MSELTWRQKNIQKTKIGEKLLSLVINFFVFHAGKYILFCRRPLQPVLGNLVLSLTLYDKLNLLNK